MSKRKKVVIFLGVIVLIIIILFSIVAYLLLKAIHPLLYTDLKNYELYKNNLKIPHESEPYAAEAVEEFLPDLKDLGNNESIELYVLQFSKNVKNELSLNLTVTYSDEIYLERKQELINNMNFVSKPIIYGDDKIFSLSQYECQYKGFEIKIVECKYFIYCSCFGMIGFNDETRQISWLFYRDSHDTRMDANNRTFEQWLDMNFRFEAMDGLAAN